jgi:hypothetical protein
MKRSEYFEYLIRPTDMISENGKENNKFDHDLPQTLPIKKGRGDSPPPNFNPVADQIPFDAMK